MGSSPAAPTPCSLVGIAQGVGVEPEHQPRVGGPEAVSHRSKGPGGSPHSARPLGKVAPTSLISFTERGIVMPFPSGPAASCFAWIRLDQAGRVPVTNLLRRSRGCPLGGSPCLDRPQFG